MTRPKPSTYPTEIQRLGPDHAVIPVTLLQRLLRLESLLSETFGDNLDELRDMLTESDEDDDISDLSPETLADWTSPTRGMAPVRPTAGDDSTDEPQSHGGVL